MGEQSRAIVDGWRKKIETLAKALVLEIVANLVKTTPVDTGWARANWIAAIGSPSVLVDGTPEAVSDAAQQASIAAVLKFTLNEAVMYVSNHVPYIVMLNYGHSKQAPPLFIEFCIDQALAKMQAKNDNIDLSAIRSDFQAHVREKITAHNVVRAFRALAG